MRDRHRRRPHPHKLRIQLHMPHLRQRARVAAQTSLDETSAVRLAHLIRAAHLGFYRGLQARLADRGIMMGHWPFLRLLWRHGSQTQRQLSQGAEFRDPTTFEALKAMEKLGLITRRRNQENRREVHVSLTRKGHDLKKPLLARAIEMNEIAVRRMDQKTIQILWDTLSTMIENFEIAEVERGGRKMNGEPRPFEAKSAGRRTVATSN